MQIKIGADPELFIYDTDNKSYVSAAGFFPGTKKEPFAVENGAIQVDGVALEFNITPAETEDQFFKNINSVMSQMTEMVEKVNPRWVLKKIPYVQFSSTEWAKVPESAKELGCDPDFMSANGNPTRDVSSLLMNSTIRTAAGHIHIGWTEEESIEDPFHFEDCRFIADGFYKRGVYTPTTNEEYSRLNYYGNHGAFRAKTYGVELRSPSNLWLNSEQSIKTIFRKTKQIFNELVPG